jgi:hypothetical protein
MKKIVLLFPLLVFLFAACAPAKATVPPTADWSKAHSAPTEDLSGYQTNISAFTAGDACPHGCWMGINPGVTTAEEAHNLLKASDQIDQNMEVTDTGIVTHWFTEKTKKYSAQAYVRMDEKGVVKSIALTETSPFMLKDLIAIFGDPSGINIDMNIYGNVMEMPYDAYYFARQTLFNADATELGVQPNDAVHTIILNVPYKESLFRPWEGYGHLAEYFKGKEVHQHPKNP